MNAGSNFLRHLRNSLLPALLLAFACNESGRGGDKNADSNSAKPVATQTATPVASRDTVVKPSDRFIEAMERQHKLYTFDFDSMLKRRLVRVLVPYSRTLFFNDKGIERGVTADNFREFERFLNQKYKKQLGHIPLTVIFVPTPRELLFEHVVKGAGDIAAGNLTATEERRKIVDFMAPDEMRVSELVLTRKKDAPVVDLAQLSGKTVHVRKSSSYYESLQKLNARFAAKGLEPIKLEIVSDNLEDEDLMEMLNAGILSVIVVDDWMAKMWAQILPSIVVNKNIAVDSSGKIGCAFRKRSPKLEAELHDYYFNYQKKLGTISYRMKRYHGKVKELQDPTKSGHARRFEEIMRLFEKYGKKYEFDPLMLAALGFQESRLNQDAKSQVGAVGVMQVMPATGSSMKVGDVHVVEPNIHAGTKYISLLMTEYFQDADFDDFNRCLFAFACYNAGPGRVAGLRKTAAERGLDPDIWLNNVEVIASEKIGQETTTYVRNITKYYYSYKLLQGMDKRHDEAARDAKASTDAGSDASGMKGGGWRQTRSTDRVISPDINRIRDYIFPKLGTICIFVVNKFR
ncbi:transglycosylase SLT domain-containing protein [Flavihumibacter solisilvae]|uniref:transglycosylase SLT domain-containing protein n=1 Tax=Flavihumibacter solisilvae TaxID=1349421 RepID=UPI0009E4587B|nr:transglycosylase SLT domain-containing protein [Flavihumibacter solisilvae]